MPAFNSTTDLADLQKSWSEQWPAALALWSKFTKLQDPRWCLTATAEKVEGLTGSFAMIRFEDHAVVISLRQIHEQKLDAYAREILAHEIGHHVYAPGDMTDYGRMIARMRAALPAYEKFAPMVSNLYTDLLINDRLQRSAQLRISEVYRALGKDSTSPVWTLYMRIYENLWQLKRGTLVAATKNQRLEFDALLGARVIRAYAKDWLDGSGRFAALLFPYLLKEPKQFTVMIKPLMDTENAGEGQEGQVPSGLSEVDEEEQKGAIHPSEDEALGDVGSEEGKEKDKKAGDGTDRNKEGSLKPEKRYRDPLDYRELLKSVGVKLSDADIAIRYYRERAMPHLIPFPQREFPESSDPLPEGLQTWEFGMPLEEVDWLESVFTSPVVVPGLTTVQRTYGTVEGSSAEKQPLDLYLGVDCSGSMVNPQLHMSWPVLSGAIMALSALRAGARVMVTLSGEPGEHVSTNGFITDEHDVLKVLTGYLGTGYTFGIPRLEEAFRDRKPGSRPAHILIVTDNDIYAMLDGGKKGEKTGWTIAKEALTAAGGGGTYILHMPDNWENKKVQRMRSDGWDVHFVTNWEELVVFARAFSQKKYGQAEGSARVPRA
jgi:hypothetical protein